MKKVRGTKKAKVGAATKKVRCCFELAFACSIWPILKTLEVSVTTLCNSHSPLARANISLQHYSLGKFTLSSARSFDTFAT